MTMGKLQGSSLDRRFFHRLGASLLDRTICATAGAAGCDVTLGTRAAIDPETVIHSRYIINWGSNTSVTNMHLWTLMHQARKAGAKIITIDPYRCKTAARSDWWIPIRPGTDAALHSVARNFSRLRFRIPRRARKNYMPPNLTLQRTRRERRAPMLDVERLSEGDI